MSRPQRRDIVSACSRVTALFDEGAPDALLDEAIERLGKFFTTPSRAEASLVAKERKTLGIR